MNHVLGRLHTRLQLLLVVVVIAVVILAALAFRITTRDSSAERMGRSLHAQVVAADALLSMPDRAAADTQMRQLGMRWRPTLPPGERPTIPLLRKTEAQVGARMPERPMRLSGSPAELWVQSRDGRGWIGIPVLGDGEPLKRGVLLSLIAITVLVLTAGAVLARTLTHPLRRLAAAAPAIVAGDVPPPLRFASDEMLELQRSLAVAAEHTRAAARDRELMLAGLSHDMRTPLARLRYGLALVESDVDASARDAMEQDIDEIDAIIGQFIDYVRDGRDEAESEVDLVEILHALVERDAQAGRDWTVIAPERAVLRGRPLALRRALGNLLANASKHGAAPFEVSLEAAPVVTVPPVVISAEAMNGAAAVAGWRLSVRDRGLGVPEDVLADLGRPFHRVDTARGTPGSGLGLASVARVAALHRGSLRLRNRDGGGLEAELRLAIL